MCAGAGVVNMLSVLCVLVVLCMFMLVLCKLMLMLSVLCVLMVLRVLILVHYFKGISRESAFQCIWSTTMMAWLCASCILLLSHFSCFIFSSESNPGPKLPQLTPAGKMNAARRHKSKYSVASNYLLSVYFPQLSSGEIVHSLVGACYV